MTSKIQTWQRVWGGALFLWSVALCNLRLFNLLAFEFAFACTIPISFLGAYCAARLKLDVNESGGGASSLPAWSLWWLAARDMFRLAWIPLIPITLNALRVKNCNWFDGAMFYLLLPMVSGVIASGWGVIIKLWWIRRDQRRDISLESRGVKREMLTFTFIFVVMILWGLYGFFTTPCVDVFSTFLGYYPGALYDEEMLIGSRLSLSRLEDMMWVAALLGLSAQSLSARQRSIIITALGVVSTLGWWSDLHRPAWWVQRQLGGYARSEHYHMYYPQGWSERTVEDLITELEFNHQELSSFFKVAPKEMTQVYFYRDARQKKRLMGAGRTLIAKPWQYSIHLHAPSVGDRVITHELAHVFSAEIAPAPHHLSLWRGILPNMGLIEGVAVAAAWTRGRGRGLMSRLTPHQWSAAMRRLDRAPPMQAIFNPQRFYAYNARLAYTSCGSFVRFYRTSRGVEALNDLYAQGGERADLEEAISEWEVWLDQMELSDRLIQTASSMLGGGSIFYKVCAHELAARRSEASLATQKQEYLRALELWRLVDQDAPGDTQSLLARVKLLIQLERLEEARSLINDALKVDQLEDQSSRSLDYLTRLRLEEWSVDLDFWMGRRSREETRERYAELLDQGMGRARWRRLAVKLYAVAEDTPHELGALILRLFKTRQTQAERIEELSSALTRWPNSAELTYLKARTLYHEEDSAVEGLLHRSVELNLSHSSLTYEALRLEADADFNRARYLSASKRYLSLAQRVDLMIEEGERSELELWSRRARFFSQRASR